MSTLHMDLWTMLTASIRRIGKTTLHAIAASSAPKAHSSNDAHGTEFDARQLSRAGLLRELLAPVSSVSQDEIYRVCDVDSSRALPASLETTVARRLQAARELLCRDMLDDLRGRPVMDSPRLLAEWLRLHCAALDYEVFLVIYLDAQHRLITIEQLFRGTLTQTSVYPREVVKAALAHHTAAVAFAHNHPSGSTEPSTADQRLTQQLKTSLALVDVRVIDHFIVAGDQHYSFAEHGLI